ncbi:MAG: sugar phosphate isomerase/epimerase [Anaerolineales bacterium]|nr:sugar phosphate isomerase/epimerase [Anaerolineales bacterium]
MKIGIDNYSYHRYFNEIYPGQSVPDGIWGLSDFVDHILNLPDIELVEGLSIETCFLPDDDKTILSQLSRLSIPLVFQWGHPDGFMGKTLKDVLEEMKRFLELNQRLGCEVLRIVVSSISYFEQPHGPQISRALDFLEKILPLAESHAVKIGLENHADLYLSEISSIIKEFDSPFLGAVLDTGNFVRLKNNPRKAISVFGEKVYLVHAKDVSIMPGYSPDDPQKYGCVPAGQGDIDFPGIFEDLRSISYDGMVLLEISRMHPDFEWMGEIKMLSRGLRYLHSLRAEKD